MRWRQFVMDLDMLPADAVEAVFARHGAQAVTLSDAADDPVLEPAPGETPLWQRTRITALFDDGADLDALAGELANEFGLEDLPPHRVEWLADRAWEREWLRDFAPMRFGARLWVCPAGLEPPDPDAVVVELDPGLAFGTGTHPTTSLCLAWLDGQPLADCRVLDFGAGSGILGIAALKLGARSVCAVDIDRQALTASRENARRNGVGDRLATARELPDESFDVVVANILAAPLVEHAARLANCTAPAARLALSGILVRQADEVRAAFAPWFDFEPDKAEGDWVRLSGRKR